MQRRRRHPHHVGRRLHDVRLLVVDVVIADLGAARTVNESSASISSCAV
jgi:hypothetical protein